jgi:formate hydrogenlyase subunit 4
MTWFAFAFNAAAIVVMPFLLTGVVNRVKSLWAGRKGPPLFQSAHDVLRLLRKVPVYSATTTSLFRVAPWILLISSVGIASVTPLLGWRPIAAFPFDFVWLAYVATLGRVALLLAALDTGSSFEGMGSAREATIATLIEPALFLVTGALCLASGARTLSDALVPRLGTHDGAFVIWFFSVAALYIVLQVESGRLPVDDPSTHLELTMVHEVMVLDHSGPDLAAIQYASALKLYVGTAMVASLLNPRAGGAGVTTVTLQLVLCVLIAVTIGTVESLIARLRLRTVPKYVALAVSSGAIALLATAWRAGGSP